jgi:O-antigen ligase
VGYAGGTGWDTTRYAGINANDLGLLLALGVPMSLYLLARSKSKIVISICWLQLALASAATLLTGSRGGMISLAVAFSLFPRVVPVMPRFRKRLSVVMLAGVLAGSAYLVPAETWDRLLKVGSELSAGTMTHRTAIWAAGWDVYQEHPLLGVGAGAYAASVRKRLDIAIVAHNTFLSVLVELGIIGALSMAGLLASMFYSAARLPYLEKRLWVVLLLTWMVGASALTWESGRPRGLCWNVGTKVPHGEAPPAGQMLPVAYEGSGHEIRKRSGSVREYERRFAKSLSMVRLERASNLLFHQQVTRRLHP